MKTEIIGRYLVRRKDGSYRFAAAKVDQALMLAPDEELVSQVSWDSIEHQGKRYNREDTTDE